MNFTMTQAMFMMMVVDRFEPQRDAVRVSVKKRCCTSEMLASGGVLRVGKLATEVTGVLHVEHQTQ